MSEIQIPFPLKGVPLKPELKGRIKIDETMIQTLSALCGWDGEARRLITCSLNGSLHITSPPVCCIVNKVSTGAAEHITFSDLPITEVIVKANPKNTGDIWLNVGAAAGVDVGYPLAPGDWLNISINNMAELRLYVVTSGDNAIIVRTV